MCFFFVVGDIFDESKYPTKDEQCQFIRWYLERLAEVHGDDEKSVTDDKIKLYRKQANICALVNIDICLQSEVITHNKITHYKYNSYNIFYFRCTPL